MVDSRNRSVEFINFLASEGIVVNIAKNKAQGNKGFFKVKGSAYRIDVAKGLTEADTLRVLLHEFAHYLHYKYDKTLKTLDFIINDLTDDVLEEMIELTVDRVSRKEAKLLFDKKILINLEIKELVNAIKKDYPDLKLSKPHRELEQLIKRRGFAHLIKYDRVRFLQGFFIKTLTIDNLDKYFETKDDNLKLYLNLKSKQRNLRRINSRINKLNKYYNSLTELFARSIETYFLDNKLMVSRAPILNNIYDHAILTNSVPLLKECSKVFL